MASLGAFAGGLGGSLQAGFQAREREKAQRGQLEEQKRSRQAKTQSDRLKAQREENTLQFSKLNDSLALVGSLIAQGNEPVAMNVAGQIRSGFADLQINLGKAGQKSPISPGLFEAKIKAQLAGQGPEARLDRQTEEARQLEEAKAAGRAAGTPDTALSEQKLIELRDRFLAAGNEEDADLMQSILEARGASESFDPRASTQEFNKKEIAKLREGIRSTASSLEELEIAQAGFRENPEAAGALGAIIEVAGGLLQQFPLFGDEVVRALNIDPAEVKRVRSQGRAVVSQMLETITQEESGRFTEAERQLARETLGTMQASSSVQQTLAGLQVGISLNERALRRQANDIALAGKFDLTQDQGLQSLFDALQKNGVPDNAALRAINQLLEFRGIVRQ